MSLLHLQDLIPTIVFLQSVVQTLRMFVEVMRKIKNLKNKIDKATCSPEDRNSLKEIHLPYLQAGLHGSIQTGHTTLLPECHLLFRLHPAVDL